MTLEGKFIPYEGARKVVLFLLKFLFSDDDHNIMKIDNSVQRD